MPQVEGLRARIRAGETVIGTFLLGFPGAAAGAAAASAGADFVLVDGEHTGFGWETMTGALAAVRHAGSVPLVRVPSASRQNIGLALDVGSQGVMVPMVASAEEAEAIGAWSRYPPAGVRGAMFGLAAHDFAEVDPLAAMAASNRDTLVIVQVETAEALDDVERIAAAPGVDVVWVGHFDLTASMGIPGRFDEPCYLAALDRVAAAAAAHGKAAGFLVNGAAEARDLADRGFRVFAYGSDIGIYRRALREGIDAIAQNVS